MHLPLGLPRTSINRDRFYMYNNLQLTYGQPPSSQPQIVAGATSGGEGGGPNIPNGEINKKI